MAASVSMSRASLSQPCNSSKESPYWYGSTKFSPMLSDIPFAIPVSFFLTEPPQAAAPRMAVTEDADQQETKIASIRRPVNGISGETLQVGMNFFDRAIKLMREGTA